MENYSNSLMTVAEMIDKALGPYKANIVDFKLIHVILHLLAKQLKVLERRVRIRQDPTAELIPSNASLSIKELKLITNVPKKGPGARMGKGTKTGTKGKADTIDGVLTPTSDINKIDKSGTKRKAVSAASTPTSNISTKSKQAEAKIISSDLETEITPELDKAGLIKEKRGSLLDKIEEQREKLLRVIHQRVDSQEEPDKNPLPMATIESIGSLDVQREKIFVVERIPSALSTSKSAPQIDQKRYTERLSIVTQEEFEELQSEVKELAQSLKTIPGPEFPDNEKLLLDLKKGASLTDAMSALQLAARLQAVEKAMTKITELLAEIAIIDPENSDVKNIRGGVIGGQDGGVKKLKSGLKSQSTEDIAKSREKIGAVGIYSKHESNRSPVMDTNINKTDQTNMQRQHQGTTGSPTSAEQNNQIVFEQQLWNSMNNLRDELTNNINNLTKRVSQVSKDVQRTQIDLGKKIKRSSDTNTQLETVQNLIAKYADRVTRIDTEYSGQLTDFQETLTQMQFELEVGIDNMMEVLASTSGDPAGISELNNKFTSLQHDFDNITTTQKELHENESKLELDLQSLLNQVELLKEAKCDREEVNDALRDKVGIGALNGLVSIPYFTSVKCDFEKEISLSYEKFNSQEVIWQKAIDELNKHLSDKANLSQVESLRNDVNNNLQKLNTKLQTLADIVGEPRAAAVTKKLFRDSACISCSTPAHIDIENENKISVTAPFKRPPTIGAESGDQPGLKDRKESPMCYIHHPIPRDHICKRYCGGSHTIIHKSGGVLSSEVKVSPLQKIGAYNENLERPCIPCNIHILPTADGQSAGSDK